MRILLITDPITPPSYAPRVMATYHYLVEAGHECVLESGELVSTSLWSKLFRRQDRQFGRSLAHKYTADRFDVILCSTYYYFPLWTARYLSNRWHIPYVVDLRDMVEQWGSSSYFVTPLPKLLGLEHGLAKCYERMNIRFRNRVLNQAKAVVSVSSWHCECLREQVSAPVHLIYNGYDARELHFVAQPTDVFRISYIGRIIDLQLRQPQLLMQALGELCQQQAIDAEHVQLDFYSEPTLRADLEQMAQQAGIAHLLHWMPYVQRDQLNSVMARSSVLVALACPPSNGQHGILGTKVFEAIGVEKPLLLVPSDQDSLAQLIQQTGIGLAAESVQQVGSFLLEQYRQWQLTGYTHRHIPNKEQFNRLSQAKQFEDLLRHSAHL